MSLDTGSTHRLVLAAALVGSMFLSGRALAATNEVDRGGWLARATTWVERMVTAVFDDVGSMAAGRDRRAATELPPSPDAPRDPTAPPVDRMAFEPDPNG